MRSTTPFWPVALIIAGFGCGGNSTTPPLPNPGQPTTKAPDTKPQSPAGATKDSETEKPSNVAKVTAEELMKGIAENRKATEEKYPEGGVIEVTGVIYRTYPIDDNNSSIFVKLYGHDKPTGNEEPKYCVSCAFSKSKQSPENKLAATLKPDQKVTIRGTNTGFFNDRGGVWLRMQDCAFIDPKP